MQRNDITITLTGHQLQTVTILLVVAIAALICVAIYSTWPKWSWEKRQR